LELEQTYQQVTGRAWLGEIEVDLLGAELCGERLEIELQANDATPVQRFTLTFADGALKSAVEA